LFLAVTCSLNSLRTDEGPSADSVALRAFAVNTIFYSHCYGRVHRDQERILT
jgi:hypothetical protein